MKMKKLLVVFMLACLVMSPTSGFAEEFPRFLRMASGSTGGAWFPLGAAMMTVIENNIPGIATSNGPGAGVGNCRAVERREFDMGWTFTATAYDAYHGLSVFDGVRHENLRHFISLFPSYFHIAVPAASNIHTIQDIEDKRISILTSMDTANRVGRAIFASYGITESTLREKGGAFYEVDLADSAELLRDNHIDVVIDHVGIPNAVFSDLAFRPGIRLLNVDDEQAEAFVASAPGFIRLEIPAGTYTGVDVPTRTVGTTTSIVIHKDVPDELVYQMLRVLYENWEETIRPVRPIDIDNSSPEYWLRGASIPIHPGAERFFNEMGITAR